MGLKKHIYLSGFMGSGKSTIGPLLARRLNVPFTDMDRLIEHELNMPIKKIFTKKGEFFFRSYETHVLVKLQHRRDQIISVGGGVVLRYANRTILKKGLWINLDCTPAVILKRVGNKTKRPLLGRKIKREHIESLFRLRRPFYDLAPYQIDTGTLSPQAVVEKIVRIIKRN